MTEDERQSLLEGLKAKWEQVRGRFALQIVRVVTRCHKSCSARPEFRYPVLRASGTGTVR